MPSNSATVTVFPVVYRGFWTTDRGRGTKLRGPFGPLRGGSKTHREVGDRGHLLRAVVPPVPAKAAGASAPRSETSTNMTMYPRWASSRYLASRRRPAYAGASAYAARMRRGFAFAAVAASVALIGCGSVSRPRSASGKALFAADCSACHSLIGSESLRRQGGDLLGYRFSRRDLLEFAREMPVRRPLSPAQLAAIVGYVSGRERSAGGH